MFEVAVNPWWARNRMAATPDFAKLRVGIAPYNALCQHAAWNEIGRWFINGAGGGEKRELLGLQCLVEALLASPTNNSAAWMAFSGSTRSDLAGLQGRLSKLPRRSEAGDSAANLPLVDDLRRILGEPGTSPSSMPEPDASGRRKTWLAAAVGLALVASLVALWQWRQPTPIKRASLAPDASSRSIAVLPFVNQSGNPDDEYFSDGMTDELASALMKVPGLRVAARSSAFTFKGRNADAREVGRKLDVATVLEGSVRRSGSKLRVTAQLVNAADGLVRWSERYEREAKDVFAVQDDITGAIVGALQLTLAAEGLASSKAGRTDNAEAHDLYLRGRFLVLKQTEEGLRKSLDYFAQALEKDPGYAPAYAGTALAHMWLADAFVPPREAEPKAKAAALKAVELDSTNAEAHTYLGLVKWFYDWEFETMDVEFQRALRLNPSSMEAHNFYGLALCAMNRWDEGIAEADRAIALDPLSPVPSWMREYCLVMSRRHDQAIQQHKKTAELDPSFFYFESQVAIAYREKGRFAEAVAEYQRLQRATGRQAFSGLAITYARMGKTAEARNILNEFLKRSERQYVSPDEIALIYASLGEKDLAFSWLDRAYEARSAFLITGIQGSPNYDPLRSDPRFDALLRKIGLKK
jgi:TolB-like protein/Tfp pilus assembly protein PilF